MLRQQKRAFNFGGAPRLQALKLGGTFKGVDYQSNIVDMDLGRSPNSRNMIINTTGFPEKRTGYSKFATVPNGKRINGIHELKLPYSETITLIHAGDTLYKWSGTDFEAVASNMHNDKSVSFQKDKKLYILDGRNYQAYSKEKGLQAAKDFAKIPMTSAGRTYQGGGGVIEKVNLISPYRINGFNGDGSNRTYQLDSKDINGIVKAEKRKTSGNKDEWEEIPSSQYSWNGPDGTITFNSPIGAPQVTGQDNLKVTYRKENAENMAKIGRCTLFDIFTQGAGDYIFLAGNDKTPNTDYRSAVNDPTYFPDLNYSVIGQEATAIMAYIKLNGKQVIVKESNGQDTSIFVRTIHIDPYKEDAKTDWVDRITFRVAQGITSTGAISKYCTISLRDDTMFMASDGLTSIATTLIGETMAQNRSYYINPHLTKQRLSEAVGIEYNSKIYIAVDGNVYVADSRHKKREQNAFAESFQYEWCHWDNFPVRVWFEKDGYLHFGDDKGNLYQIKKPEANDANGSAYKDNGKPIEAYWDTPFMSFNDISRVKTLKDLYIILKPEIRTSCDILFRAKGRPLRPDKPDRSISLTKYADIFSWDNIDFSRFSFITDDAPVVLPAKTKIKRFALLQLRFVNKKPENFGIYDLQLNYTINGKYKG